MESVIKMLVKAKNKKIFLPGDFNVDLIENVDLILNQWISSLSKILKFEDNIQLKNCSCSTCP